EDQPAYIGSADGGVDRIGIIVEPDAQHPLGPRGGRGGQGQREDGEHDADPGHDLDSSLGISASDPRPSTATAPPPARRTMSGFTSRSMRRAPRSAASQERG